MAAKISNITELFHRFHQCEMQLRQGKIAACLIAFRELIEKMPAIPKTEKEKGELHSGIEIFLKNLSAHKKFQEIFGVMSFGDTDLETNLEFIKNMIVAQEEEIVERIKKDEEASEAKRLEIDQDKQKQQEETLNKTEQAIAFIDQDDLPQAIEIIKESDEIREAVVLYYNDAGMRSRMEKSFDDAIKNYSRAQMVSPEDENLHYNMARAYYEAGLRDKAENCLAQAMQLNPDFREGQVFYGHLLELNHPKVARAASDNKSGGFFGKIFGKKG